MRDRTLVPDYMRSTCYAGVCRNEQCAEAVKQDPTTGRYFITMSHSGFNSPTNNKSGYTTEKSARAAFAKYAARD